MDHNDSYVVSSEAEFVSIGTEEAPAIIPVGTYTAKKLRKILSSIQRGGNRNTMKRTL